MLSIFIDTRQWGGAWAIWLFDFSECCRWVALYCWTCAGPLSFTAAVVVRWAVVVFLFFFLLVPHQESYDDDDV